MCCNQEALPAPANERRRVRLWMRVCRFHLQLSNVMAGQRLTRGSTMPQARIITIQPGTQLNSYLQVVSKITFEVIDTATQAGLLSFNNNQKFSDCSQCRLTAARYGIARRQPTVWSWKLLRFDIPGRRSHHGGF